ncbi:MULTISPECIES: DUF3284 domain-containing protein [Clostridium]|jgi:hypothetical protein|uniref:DUF3284 domain-containing protein n=3 Tax=Clostridium TaxID=1485 RepID=A0A1S9N461_CLOBE|nr:MULTISPECIES: DUF3284 domain-containing protein [Clostridium]ABR32983.1 hypothetical protein Cbei_0799 [Clostridium beijerinckii NCIMB 8052]AIU04812.1 hypothetical protein Cbs_0799 [Clostridium beijerinckii ATCC 35702]MBA8936369.1 hypothetical protein [Clostridium beijerinckii]MBF7807336.1 DUF3284 domain-containing protein [Clostridium beijerinckii]MBN7573808.1 DUF3284 domain-containing protein [Clostridium beijerinckii]
MKAIGILNYPVEDVFHIFIKNAKKDFSDFNEEDATGCKIQKSINTGRPNPVECTVEITGYAKNEKYQITTSTDFTTCVSTYNFKGQKDGTTKLVFEEEQSTDKFFGYMSLWIQRFMARRAFKAKYNNIVEALNNELKTYANNKERSKPKNK